MFLWSHVSRYRQRSWPEPRQDDGKQEITIIPQCSYTGFLALYLAVDGEPLTVDLTLLADPDQEHCQDDIKALKEDDFEKGMALIIAPC